jgi:hypothetical protein
MSGILTKSLTAIWLVLFFGSVAGTTADAGDAGGRPSFKVGDRLPDAGSGSTPVRLILKAACG